MINILKSVFVFVFLNFFYQAQANSIPLSAYHCFFQVNNLVGQGEIETSLGENGNRLKLCVNLYTEATEANYRSACSGQSLILYLSDYKKSMDAATDFLYSRLNTPFNPASGGDWFFGQKTQIRSPLGQFSGKFGDPIIKFSHVQIMISSWNTSVGKYWPVTSGLSDITCTKK